MADVTPSPVPIDLQAQYTALAKQMADANTALQKQMDEVQAENADLKTQMAPLQAKYADLMQQRASLQADNLTLGADKQRLQFALRAAEAKIPPSPIPPTPPEPVVPVVYPNIPGMCIAVPGVKGSRCPNCGWQVGGLLLKDREPHLMSAPPPPKPGPPDPPKPPPAPYVYAPGQCRPVLEFAGEECPNCGWVFEGKMPLDKEPHPAIPS